MTISNVCIKFWNNLKIHGKFHCWMNKRNGSSKRQVDGPTKYLGRCMKKDMKRELQHKGNKGAAEDFPSWDLGRVLRNNVLGLRCYKRPFLTKDLITLWFSSNYWENIVLTGNGNLLQKNVFNQIQQD